MSNFEKYRRQTHRLAGFDYSSPGYYFVTICTKYIDCCFGEIINNKMKYSPLGLSAVNCWLNIPKHFPFVILDKFIVMPNHVHGILFITWSSASSVATQNFASLQANPWHYNKFGPQSKNLASIIRGYKIGVTKYAQQNNLDFIWQPRYYDQIIRSNEDLFRVHEYIRNNPAKWAEDRNNPKNLKFR